MTSKFSRAALIAGLAIGAGGLVAVPAEAANGVSTANYYVHNPGIGAASNITPESAVVSASIDTGGSPESLLPVPAAGLAWSPLANIVIAAGEQWNDGTAPSLTTPSPAAYVPLDGLPVSGSNSDVGVKLVDSALTPSTSYLPVSNGGADNFSDVTFEYDPVSDYDSADNLPGPNTQQAQDIQVPTTTGVSSVSTMIGAFGQAAQNNSGNTPLTPGTKYYYWIIEQAGGTDAAVNINIAAWANTDTAAVPTYNPTYKCYPIAAIEQDPTLNAYYQGYLAGSNPQVSYPGSAAGAPPNPVVDTNQPAVQGPCPYYYGNTGGQLYPQSPNGTFTTPAIGKLKIGKATATAKGANLAITDSSAYKASGTVALTIGGKLAGTVKFGLQPNAKGSFKVSLTAKGKAALAKKKTVRVAPVSQTANVASVSNWDQPLVGKSVKL